MVIINMVNDKNVRWIKKTSLCIIYGLNICAYMTFSIKYIDYINILLGTKNNSLV